MTTRWRSCPKFLLILTSLVSSGGRGLDETHVTKINKFGQQPPSDYWTRLRALHHCVVKCDTKTEMALKGVIISVKKFLYQFILMPKLLYLLARKLTADFYKMLSTSSHSVTSKD